ncbi:hypothetical protein [Bdellovibrio sp. NC01]|uniref:hypothetical protein n=1 Tax=Bdellovibrio sp. NC01 TaxID=2220073 RepID=UPI00115BEC54|nr:hypothetical protein [Bdellovibrio sp. NC01]QDK37555.1 hypothetical protein DOE51_08145 [Bdellovibrio sp. NC01]
MGAFKEIYDEEVYLPEQPSNQIEFKGLLELFTGFKVYSAHAEENEISEVATPIKPLSNDIVIRL